MTTRNGSFGLNHRQERFCVEYLIDMNATQAALRAGYAKKTAQHQASRLLGNVGISRRLREALEERNERIRVDSDWVLKRLGELFEADIAMLFDQDYELRPFDDLPDAAGRLIASVEFEPGQGRKVRRLKLLDRLKVLELIGNRAYRPSTTSCTTFPAWPPRFAAFSSPSSREPRCCL